MCLVPGNGENQTVSLSAPLLAPAAEDVCPGHPFLWLVARLKRDNSFLQHLGGNSREEKRHRSYQL